MSKQVKNKVRVGIDVIVSPITKFASLEASSGIFLLLTAIAAMLCANLGGAKEAYFNFINTPVVISVAGMTLNKTLLLLVNDGLMAVFFYLVGLEIKKEVLSGELSSPKKASFSFFAAIGGMVFPALIYFFMTKGTEASVGWGIPMATDIAFALGVLTLLSKRVPVALKVFLLALAIVDDLGAILIIALFYSGEIAGSYLGAAMALILFLAMLNYAGIRNKFFGIVVGFIVWFFFLKSGVHATIAGVLLALITPAFNNVKGSEQKKPMLDTYIHDLHPWSAFLIMPIFAFFNAGVDLSGFTVSEVISAEVSLGVIFGLLLGKPVGVLIMTVLATKMKWATLPAGTTWMQVTAVGFISAIGFTMSLFIAGLAFTDPQLVSYSKVSIIIASVLAMIIGFLMLFVSTKPRNS